VLCFDPVVNRAHWLVTDYLPELGDIEDDRAPAPAWVAGMLGGRTHIETVPVPADCTDGFQNAYWRRPEAYLDANVRACTSTLAVLDPVVLDRGLERLADDLGSGAWHARHRHLLELDELDGGYRLVVAERP
jgi:hypothetical protein